MQRESRLGRALWLVLVAVLGGYVLASFFRSPFSAPSGAAAVRPTTVTIWMPADESGDESGPVLKAAARSLEAQGHPVAVRNVRGGAAATLVSVLAADRTGPARLLAITSATIADLAHDRRQTLVPGMAEEAALARTMLRRARPIGILTEAPLELAVAADSGVGSGSELVASMTAAPGDQLFGIDDDIYSRDQLATLVEGAGVDGEIRFSTFQSAVAAAQATETGAVRTTLAARPALRPAILAGDLHGLGWPLPGPRPRSWVALVAPPGIGDAELAKLRAWIGRMRTTRLWRRDLRAEGRSPGAPGTLALARLLRRSAPADRLERMAERIENG